MSRIGRKPIVIPPGVNVDIQGSLVSVKGPKGELSRVLPSAMIIELEDGQIVVKRQNDEPMNRALHGLTRTLVDNMVTGVNTGFEKILEVNGVGYRAEVDGQKNLVLYMGYSHPVVMPPPSGISYQVDAKTRQIKVLGYDKELVGQQAANIRKVRPPEPYHGKGIKYLDETIRRKAGKTGKA